MDWYALLAVDRTATDAEIRRAYRRAALKYHPDKTKESNTDQFDLISEAFRVLSDPDARRQFDAQITHQRVTNQSTTNKDYFRTKLADQEKQSDSKPFESLEALQEDFEHRRQALQLLLDSQSRNLAAYRTLRDEKRCFGSIAEARKHIDAHGGYILDSYMETEYSPEYESATISRLPAD